MRFAFLTNVGLFNITPSFFSYSSSWNSTSSCRQEQLKFLVRHLN
jgi:hypothetical protein